MHKSRVVQSISENVAALFKQPVVADAGVSSTAKQPGAGSEGMVEISADDLRRVAGGGVDGTHNLN